MISKCNDLFKNRIVKNFLLIFTGEGIGSIFGFISTLVIIKAIGSYQHGVLVAIQTYVNLFYGLLSFKTFQALIKYLAIAEKKNDVINSKIYIKWSFLLDCFCVCLTFILGYLLKTPVISIMGWKQEISRFCIFYLAIYLLNFQGTTIGVLRYFEKYQLVVKSNVCYSVFKSFGFLICLILKLDFKFFFIADCLSNLIKFALMNYYTYKTLKQKGLIDFMKVKLELKPSFLKFCFFCNLTSTIDLPVNQITTLIINKYLGFEATSVYSVFGSLGSIINKLGDPISQVIYPEMNQKIVNKDINGAKKLSYVLKILMLLIFGMGTIFVIFTHSFWLRFLISNPSVYVTPLIIYLGYACYCNAAMGTHNLFLALGYVKYNIPILIVVNIIYLALLNYYVQTDGLTGVIIVYFLQAFVVVCIKEIIMRIKHYEETSYEQSSIN